MTDVIQKVISANDIKQGRAVTNGGSPEINNYEYVEPSVNEEVDTDSVETKYTNRFRH